MLASLRRIYLYAVASAALIFLIAVLQNFIFQFSVQAGVPSPPYSDTSATDFSRAFVFLLVALAIVLPVGLLHWWLIRRDAQTDPAANGGVVRVIFLDLLTVLVGLVTVFAMANFAYAVFFDTSANYNTFYYYDYSPGLAVSLSIAAAWGVGLLAVVLERRATLPLTGVAWGISMVLGYAQQIVLLISVMAVGARAVQTVLDATIQALPTCVTNNAIDNTGCQPPPPISPLGSVAQTLVLLASLIGFTLWTRRDGGSVFRQLADSIFLISATVTAVNGLYFLVNLLLNLATSQGAALPLALVGNNAGQSYPFLGPLLVGGGALAYYFTRAWRMPLTGTHPQQARQVAIVGVALPLAFTFLFGVVFTLYLFFRSVQGNAVSLSDWLQPWSLLIAGAGWLALWPILARMSDPRGSGPLVPRRAYAYILFASSLLAGVISLAVGLYFVVTAAISATVDTNGQGSDVAFAIALVGAATAGYYLFVLVRDGRTLRARAPVPAPAPDATVTPTATLESVLQAVAAGQMAVPQAAAILREQFGAK